MLNICRDYIQKMASKAMKQNKDFKMDLGSSPKSKTVTKSSVKEPKRPIYSNIYHNTSLMHPLDYK